MREFAKFIGFAAFPFALLALVIAFDLPLPH